MYPDLRARDMQVDVAYVNRCVGTALDAPAVAALLSRMALDAEVAPGGAAVRVCVPPTRSDVLHACDVMEVRGVNVRYMCTRTEACRARPGLSFSSRPNPGHQMTGTF